jgi:RNA polymerase sigma factor (TIGR02999 family)
MPRRFQKVNDVSDATKILEAIERGEPQAAGQLLPLVYVELRKLAAARLACEKPGQSLQATALVHEVYLRLVGDADAARWQNRGHFFAAAAEAMRRILVEAARRRQSLKRGGDRHRQNFDRIDMPAQQSPDDVIAVHESLDRLATVDPRAAELVKLRYFAGFTNKESADVLGIAPRTADNLWAYARAWLAVDLKSFT